MFKLFFLMKQKGNIHSQNTRQIRITPPQVMLPGVFKCPLSPVSLKQKTRISNDKTEGFFKEIVCGI